MRNNILITIIIFCCIVLPGPVFASSVTENIEAGNSLYEQGKYDDAVKAYQRAREDSPDSDIANFNLGAALYKKGRYQEAIEAFTKSLSTEDRKMEADAIYNIANAGYKLGSQQAGKYPRGAADLYRQSVEYYKRALELDQGNDDARYNLELVKRKLKELQEKLKNQPEKQEQESGQKEKDEKGKEQESQNQNKKNSQDGQDEGQQKAGKDGDKQQAQQENSQQRDKTGEEDAGQEYGEEKTGMTPEEARMLLDAFGEEGNMQDMNKQQGEGYYPEVLKNW